MHSNTMQCYSKVSPQLDKRSSWARKCFLPQCTSKILKAWATVCRYSFQGCDSFQSAIRAVVWRELPLATSSARQAAEVVKILGSAKARSWDVLCALGAPQVGRVQTVARRGPELMEVIQENLTYFLTYLMKCITCRQYGWILDECVVIFMQRLCSAFARLGR